MKTKINDATTGKNNKIKSMLQPSQQTGVEFLLSIAGIFNSSTNDSSENVDAIVAEAILKKYEKTHKSDTN